MYILNSKIICIVWEKIHMIEDMIKNWGTQPLFMLFSSFAKVLPKYNAPKTKQSMSDTE